MRWEHLALARLFTELWETHPSHVLLCALPLWGREMAPHPLLIASLRWMCFSKGKALVQPVNLWDIWMLILQRNKNQGTNWEQFVSWQPCMAEGVLCPGAGAGKHQQLFLVQQFASQ